MIRRRRDGAVVVERPDDPGSLARAGQAAGWGAGSARDGWSAALFEGGPLRVSVPIPGTLRRRSVAGAVVMPGRAVGR